MPGSAGLGMLFSVIYQEPSPRHPLAFNPSKDLPRPNAVAGWPRRARCPVECVARISGSEVIGPASQVLALHTSCPVLEVFYIETGSRFLLSNSVVFAFTHKNTEKQSKKNGKIQTVTDNVTQYRHNQLLISKVSKNER